MKVTYLFIVGIVAVCAGFVIVLQSRVAFSDVQIYTFKSSAQYNELSEILEELSEDVPAELSQLLTEPVVNFHDRVTKKPFGIYITPTTSPIQPEKFSGYHTGVDVEFTDTEGEVLVVAIADGEVIVSRRVNGYGGVSIVRHEINDENILTLYGHLDPSSLTTAGEFVQAGEQIGHLGKGGTSETDGERKHLHIGMLRGNSVSYLGYVATEEALKGWYDPMDFFLSN